jgi:hypothetical protein
MKRFLSAFLLVFCLASFNAPKANAGVFYLVKSAINFSNDEIGKGILNDVQGVTNLAGGIILATNGLSFSSFGQSMIGMVAIALIGLNDEEKKIEGLDSNLSQMLNVSEEVAAELIDEAEITQIEGQGIYNVEVDCSMLDADELGITQAKLNKISGSELCSN